MVGTCRPTRLAKRDRVRNTPFLVFLPGNLTPVLTRSRRRRWRFPAADLFARRGDGERQSGRSEQQKRGEIPGRARKGEASLGRNERRESQRKNARADEHRHAA